MALTAAAATARSKHLEAASQDLLAKSPSISAYLQSIKQAQADKTPGASGSPVCQSCGSIILPGWNCKTISNKKTAKRTRQDRLTGISNRKYISLECSLCNEVTTLESQKPKTGEDKTIKKPEQTKAVATKVGTILPSEAISTVTVPNPTTTAVDSLCVKKRSRGKKTSLAAMLADRKTTGQTKGFGLELEDFMKAPG